MGRCAFVLVALAASQVAAQDADWRGETAFPRTNGVPLRDAPGGKTIGSWALSSGRVVALADGDWVEVRHEQVSIPLNGWVKRSEVVRLPDAAALYTNRIRAAPADAWGWSQRGHVWTERKEHANAIADYTEAIRLEPSAFLYNARGCGWRHEGKYDRSVADLTEAIRLDPKEHTSFNNRGLAWDKTGEHDKAIADYTEAIRLEPTSTIAFNNRGGSWNEKKEYGKAVADYSEAVRLDPKNAMAYCNRGRVRISLGEYDRAIADYAESIRLDAKYARAFNERGHCYFQKADYGAATADFTRAIELNPNDPEYYTNRGVAREKTGAFRKAAADFETAARVAPADPHVVYMLAVRLAACPDAAVRDGRRAVELATRVCELTGWKERKYFAALGAAHAEVGDYRLAIEYEERALADGAYARQFAEGGMKRLALYTRRQPYRLSAAK